jgi:hypothetical protein
VGCLGFERLKIMQNFSKRLNLSAVLGFLLDFSQNAYKKFLAKNNKKQKIY